MKVSKSVFMRLQLQEYGGSPLLAPCSKIGKVERRYKLVVPWEKDQVGLLRASFFARDLVVFFTFFHGTTQML